MGGNERLQKLVLSLQDLFANADHPRVRDIATAWPQHSFGVAETVSSSLPVTDWLPEAVRYASVSLAPFVQDACDLRHDLKWQQTYSADDLSPLFLERYGWSMLVGPDAPVESTSILSGLLLLGPDVLYPPHQHAAEEAYIILSGEASWMFDDADWSPLEPGAVIFNPSWRLHGMRTDRGQPLLLAFLWKAGAVEKSIIVGSD